jgi:two-component system sensor histidine kinase KdpD
MTEHRIEQTWAANERVLVGFDHRGHTRQVIRSAWRLAHGLHADLIAVCIEPAGYHAFSARLIGLLRYGSQARQQREAAQRRLAEHATLAEDLGAEIIRTRSKDIARTLLAIAKERQVTQMVLGQPARSRWEELIRSSMINRLLRLNTAIDIHLVPRSQE